MITIPGHGIVAHVRAKLIQHVYIPCIGKDRLLGWEILHTTAPISKSKATKKKKHICTKRKSKNAALNISWKRTLVYRMQRERRQRVSWLQICWGHAQWVNGLFSAPCHESYGLQTLRKWNTFLWMLGDFKQCVFIIVTPHTLPNSYLIDSCLFLPLS